MKAMNAGLLILVLITLNSLNTGNAFAENIQRNKTITIKLNSIHCDMCVENTTKAINAVDGVIEVSVNLDKKTATVTYDTDKTSKNEIENAITSAGYDANNKSANPKAYEKLNACCKRP